MRAKTDFSGEHVRLPLELFVLVTDALSTEHASSSLAQLALVSRGLRHIVTPALYHTIFINKSEETAFGFAQTVKDSRVLAGYVRVLSVPHRTPALNSILIACTSIKTLHCFAPPPQQDFADAIQNLKNLSTLFFEIQRVDYDAALRDTIGASLRSLHVLSFDRISCEDWRATMPLLMGLEEFACTVTFSDAFEATYRIPHFLGNLLKRSNKLQRVRCVLFGHDLKAQRLVNETKQLLNAIQDSRFSYSVFHGLEDASQMHIMHLQGRLSLWDLDPEDRV